MSRINPDAISTEIRTQLKNYTLPNIGTLGAIPSGRDPRRFLETDQLPQVVVQFTSGVSEPKSIGGGIIFHYGVCLYTAFRYADEDDINMMRLLYSKDLFDFIADNKISDTYKLFQKDGRAPSFDYTPEEERSYERAGMKVALVKCEYAVTERYIIAL